MMLKQLEAVSTVVNQANLDLVCTTLSLQLNQRVCGSYNRDGQLCGECRDRRFAPPVYSYEVSCVECEDYRYNWLKFIAVLFFPLTLFWFAFIVFRISATSGLLNAIVFISQLLTTPQRMRSLQQIQKGNSLTKVFIALITLHSVWNLDFFRLIYSPFCLHPQMSTIQAIALDYLIAVYPLILIVVTYLLVELHDYYRVVSWLWRPFLKCFLSFRRNWNIRASLIDAFATFLLLSYVKFLMVSIDLLIPVDLYGIHGKIFGKRYLYFDGSTEYFGKEHLPYAILAIGVLLIFNIFPIVLLFLYTCSFFQKCLNRARLNWQVLHIFMDAFQGCYKDGTEGTRDCRWFSAVYPLAQFVGLTLVTVVYSVPNFWISVILFLHLILILVVGVVRPYKSPVYNTADSFLLFVSATLYLSDVAGNTASVRHHSQLAVAMRGIGGFVYLVPLIYLAGVILYKLCARTNLAKKIYERIKILLPCNCNRGIHRDFEESLPDRLVHPEEYEPLLIEHRLQPDASY